VRRIRIIVVEDNRLLREGLTAMLNEQSDMTVVASLGNGEALVRGSSRFKADVILLDLVLKSHISLQFVESLMSKKPDAKIIVMDLAPVQPALVEYVSAGVCGFVLRDATFDEFLRSIREVVRGSKVLPPTLTPSLLSQIAEHATLSGKGDPFKAVRMTNREREVVELIAEGLSNKQIAERLHCAVDTVKSHVHNILEKLALHTRLEIANYLHAGGPLPSSTRSPRRKGG
jgi:DNA-binding NarL/FixJ family response regulator